MSAAATDLSRPPQSPLYHLPALAVKVPVSAPEFPVSSEKFPDLQLREFYYFLLMQNGKTGVRRAGWRKKSRTSLYFPLDQGNAMQRHVRC